MIFSARPAQARASADRTVALDTQLLTCQLVHTLTAALASSQPLSHFTEMLGLKMALSACLILWHHQPTDSVAYVSWKEGDHSQCCELSTTAISSQTIEQRRAALALLKLKLEPMEAALEPQIWTSLDRLLQDEAHSPNWLGEIRSCLAIPIPAVPNTQAVMVLLSRCPEQQVSIDRVQAGNLVSLVAIALQQQILQQQALRSSEQLRYLNYLKEDFLSTLNHELRTPLTSMMLAIRMLRRSDLPPERTAMYLSILEQQCSREINLVNDLLMLQTVDRGTVPIQRVPVNLGALLATLIDDVNDSFTAARLALVFHAPAEPVLISTSATHLTRALRELLTNACKYSTSGSQVTLTLTKPTTIDGTITVQLSNVGAGIQADELPHIFDKFRRGSNATRNAIPGTGTGLALVRGLIEQIGGQVSVSSQPLEGTLWQTCFTIQLKLYSGNTQDL
ncbi:MAG: HAMP domain-containing histidine kinase [Leptolyngbyaceae cyanobacterium SM2_5_2]|nr:HAMP domain-containing histidine kinase [Leptolyngbyaceae cyanobacterium SM2_5_2]